jgi:hypothetical protein
MGGNANLAWWADPRTPNAVMKNVLIAHNTFVEAVISEDKSGQGSIRIRSAAHQNVRIENNIVKQNGLGNPVSLGSGDIVFSSNLWSKAPVSGARAWNDIIADPQLTGAGGTGAGQLTGAWFQLKSTSPAIGQATVISTILDDYFGNFRDSSPDIGGHEFIVSP